MAQQINNNDQTTRKNRGANIALNFALFFLCIHLFTVNSRLLYHMNPDGITSSNVFDFMNLGTENIIAMVISISYSVMTVIIIKALQMPFRDFWNFSIIAFFGILDAIGVALYYIAPVEFKIWGSLYFALYTFSIIVSFGLYQSFQRVSPKDELKAIRSRIYKRKAQLNYQNLENDPVLKELVLQEQSKLLEL